MSKLDRIDKIILSMQDIQRMSEWAETNEIKQYVFYPFFEEAVIQTEIRRAITGPSLKISIYFKMLSDIEDDNWRFYFEIYDAKGIKNLSFIKDFNKENAKDIKVHRETEYYLDADNINFFVKFATGVYANLMGYISLNKNEKESLHPKKVRIATKRKKSGSSKKKVSRSLLKTIYTLELTEEDMKKATRNYERVKESWGVRGHWREYKTGKRVWIRPYVKGQTIKKESSVYRL